MTKITIRKISAAASCVALMATAAAASQTSEPRVGGAVAPKLDAPQQPQGSWRSDTSYDATRAEMQRIQQEQSQGSGSSQPRPSPGSSPSSGETAGSGNGPR